MNPVPNRDTLEEFSAGLALTLKVQRAWSDILNRTIITKALMPLPGYYPDFALPGAAGIAELRQDYVTDACLNLADLARQPVLSRAQCGLLEELINDPAVLLEYSLKDLDGWEHRARRHLEEFRKLSGKLEKAAELDLVENEDNREEEE
jgi:hypothetical protein